MRAERQEALQALIDKRSVVVQNLENIKALDDKNFEAFAVL